MQAAPLRPGSIANTLIGLPTDKIERALPHGEGQCERSEVREIASGKMHFDVNCESRWDVPSTRLPVAKQQHGFTVEQHSYIHDTMATEKREQINLRLDPKLLAQARSVSIDSTRPYAPTLTQVIERGIELALEELRKKK